MDGTWIEVRVITKSEALEPVSGIFYSLDCKGVAIEDPEDILGREQGPLTLDFADINVLEHNGKFAVVKAYFAEEDNIEEILGYVNEKLVELKEMGIDISLCSFRIYVNDHGKNGDGSDATFTLTVSSKRITNEMAETKEEFQITRYIFTGGIKEGNYSKYTGTAKAVLKSENDTSGIRHTYAVIEANANSLKPVK